MPMTVVLAVGLDSSPLTTQNSVWKPAGYVVTPTGSIREAIERFKSVDFDPVLLGHSIPIEHRERLAFLIRASGSRTPVICIADPACDPQSFADATLKNDASALPAGMEELLVKTARKQSWPADLLRAAP
jgi:CheY-like chemotaxis protein